MKLPKHLIVAECDGCLYDTRADKWHLKQPVRPNYKWTHRLINTCAELKATLRAGEYAWPGGYPMHFITEDGAALSFKAVREELRCVLDSIKAGGRDGWRVIGCQINWEDGNLLCDHTGERIPSAYAGPEAEVTQ